MSLSPESGKKRVRKLEPEDTDPDKKLKADEKPLLLNGVTNNNGTSHGTTNGGALPATNNDPPIKKSTVPPPPEVFLSPVAAKKDATADTAETVEETPYMTARQDKESKEARNKYADNKTTPTKLAPKLESIQEESSKKAPANNNPQKVKVVRRGSMLCTVFLLFMWIASSAVLGGLWLKEKLEHDMDLFRLQQELLDQPPPEPIDETELEKLVKQLKIKAAEAEGTLSGYKNQFQETLTKLEHHHKAQ